MNVEAGYVRSGGQTEGGDVPAWPPPSVGSLPPSCRLDIGSHLYQRLRGAVEK